MDNDSFSKFVSKSVDALLLIVMAHIGTQPPSYKLLEVHPAGHISKTSR
jgi:hypothetical protein